MNTTLNEIYHVFDKHGIPLKKNAIFSTNTDDLDFSKQQLSAEVLIQPDLSQFQIFEDEAEIIICRYVKETVGLVIQSFSELLGMRFQNERPFFVLLNEYDTTPRLALASGTLDGSVSFRKDDKVTSLGNIEEILGDLGFSESGISSLGQLKKVHGSLWVAQSGIPMYTNLTSLGKLEYVGKDLTIKNSPINDLGALIYVGGNLNLRSTKISRLNENMFIGGNLFLSSNLKGNIDLSLVTIKESTRYYQ